MVAEVGVMYDERIHATILNQLTRALHILTQSMSVGGLNWKGFRLTYLPLKTLPPPWLWT